ncbi:hypothetical protein G6F31_021403 [Rhizopus arrhizus]|nr:hypothetical protein G6F31_021403 [Rhizopus arrhizus]
MGSGLWGRGIPGFRKVRTAPARLAPARQHPRRDHAPEPDPAGQSRLADASWTDGDPQRQRPHAGLREGDAGAGQRGADGGQPGPFPPADRAS